ncbi:SdpI family protein [Nonomuraea aridisoli]|uniref:DUF1648 domain-containing protein n=1 Tax=Nonomuraea aridisoli TaxID=2070368 RepID=A0A2W2EBE7_9ACTN|nr:SdpI family protein [Nonomuraea aridisoli]PZG19771.1 hypothetical protein C1J01_11165 [Nonomuraea aridisoli]
MKHVPWAGVVVAALAVVAMTAVGRQLWDVLPDVIETRRATADRPAVHVPKLVMAAAMPMTLVVMGAIVAGAAAVGERLRPRLHPMFVATPAARRRGLNMAFILLSPLLTVVHTGVLLDLAGHAFPMEQAVGVAFGCLVAGVGLALPRLRERALMPAWHSVPAPGWDRAQRLGGRALVALGVVCAAGVLVLPPLPVAVVCCLAAGGILMGTVLLPLLAGLSRR